MTAYAHEDDRRRCFATGMDGIVIKPINPDELFATIDALTAQAPPAAPGPAQSVDWPHALRTAGNDPALLRAVAQTAREEIPRLVAELRQAIAADDAGRLGRTAHTLAGVVRCFGAQGALDSALQLQSAGRAADLAAAAPLLAMIEGQMARLTEELDAFLQRA